MEQNEETTSKNVLVVEDDEDLSFLFATKLQSIGKVWKASSAEEALELIDNSSFSWHLIVSDIGLPGISGLEFVKKIRHKLDKTAILMLTAHATFQYAVEAIQVGADDYLTKPVGLQELVEKSIKAMEKRNESLTVLAIGAHPDDVEIGCGGTLAKHVQQNADVHILTATGGSQGGEKEIRLEESRQAAKVLGANLHLLDLEDTHLSEGGATIDYLNKVVEKINPSIVYTHTVHDVHQDHRNIHKASLVSLRQVPQVYAYQSPSTSVDFKPTRFLVIDDFIDKKLLSIEEYHSQTQIRNYLDEDLLRSTARYWSRFAKQGLYAEPFEVIRDSKQ